MEIGFSFLVGEGTMEVEVDVIVFVLFWVCLGVISSIVGGVASWGCIWFT